MLKGARWGALSRDTGRVTSAEWHPGGCSRFDGDQATPDKGSQSELSPGCDVPVPCRISGSCGSDVEGFIQVCTWQRKQSTEQNLMQKCRKPRFRPRRQRSSLSNCCWGRQVRGSPSLQSSSRSSQGSEVRTSRLLCGGQIL